VSLVFVVTNKTLLAMLIGIDHLWAILEHIEVFFINWWPSQEKVF
jgi:hypothetical protein